VQSLIVQLNIIFLEKLIATYIAQNLPVDYETQVHDCLERSPTLGHDLSHMI